MRLGAGEKELCQPQAFVLCLSSFDVMGLNMLALVASDTPLSSTTAPPHPPPPPPPFLAVQTFRGSAECIGAQMVILAGHVTYIEAWSK